MDKTLTLQAGSSVLLLESGKVTRVIKSTQLARAARLSLQTLPGREVGEDVDELEAPAARGVAALAVVVDHLEASEGALQDLWGKQKFPSISDNLS